MSISYAPLEEEEVFLPPPKQIVKQTPEIPKFREGTECNVLILFFTISILYIIMSD